jgi:CDP-2,3-bis-(O-geranylgeranyl)-sn-glycerol synthase
MVTNLLYSLIFYPILFILPAWVANGTPVLFAGRMPLDLGGRLWGKRIFGDHKTVRGTAAGIAGGIVVAGLEYSLIGVPLALGAALTTGAIAGDLFGSFVKRRAGAKEGSNVPIMDQYLFFIFALLFALPLGLSYFPSLIGLVVIVVLTGVLHRLTNVAAHRARLKDVPW